MSQSHTGLYLHANLCIHASTVSLGDVAGRGGESNACTEVQTPEL